MRISEGLRVLLSVSVAALLLAAAPARAQDAAVPRPPAAIGTDAGTAPPPPIAPAPVIEPANANDAARKKVVIE